MYPPYNYRFVPRCAITANNLQENCVCKNRSFQWKIQTLTYEKYSTYLPPDDTNIKINKYKIYCFIKNHKLKSTCIYKFIYIYIYKLVKIYFKSTSVKYISETGWGDLQTHLKLEEPFMG